MDNHIMYFWDEDGEIALSRCCLCEKMIIIEGRLECSCGHDCTSDECYEHVPVEKNKISVRFADIRRELI